MFSPEPNLVQLLFNLLIDLFVLQSQTQWKRKITVIFSLDSLYRQSHI